MGGEGVSRKRGRALVCSETCEEEATDTIPNQEILKELVSKSFSYGDFFKPWRNRHFRTFALGYTQGAVEELLYEFSHTKNISSIDQVKTTIEEKMGKEITDLEKRNHNYKIWAQELFGFCSNEVKGINNLLPLRRYFNVSPNSLSSVVLSIPFAKEYMEDDFLKWKDDSLSYFDVFRKVCGLLQTLSVFKCKDKNEAFDHCYQEFFMFFKSDDFISDVLQMNMTVFKVKLEGNNKKLEKLNAILKRKETALSNLETQIVLCESEMQNMKLKMKEITENNGFLKVLESISLKDKTSFVDDIQRVIESKIAIIDASLTENKKERDLLNVMFSNEIDTVVGKSGVDMLKREIAFNEQCISEIQHILDDGFARDEFIKCVRCQFEEECNGIRSLCEYVSMGPDFVKCMIKSLSKIISSKEVMLEGICKMASDLKKAFA